MSGCNLGSVPPEVMKDINQCKPRNTEPLSELNIHRERHCLIAKSQKHDLNQRITGCLLEQVRGGEHPQNPPQNQTVFDMFRKSE